MVSSFRRIGGGVCALVAISVLASCGQPTPTSNGVSAVNASAASVAAPDSADDAALNATFAKSTHDSCVPSATAHGVTPEQAEKYCTCVVAQLAPLPLAEKMQLATNQTKLQAAAATCNAQISGG
ncbi:MAG TPA: hypothetical protein VGI95_06690 [Caulobacteraceae bacterium]|jgi:hypothetical protein